MSARDSQRSRVYAAEQAAGINALGQEFATVADCQRFVNKVVRSRLWKSLYCGTVHGFVFDRKYHPAGHHVIVRDGRGSSHARAGAYALDLPKWSRHRWVIVHELAHVAAPRSAAGHGREFCSIYLKLVKRFVGEAQAAVLRQQFVIHRVRHIPRAKLAPTLKKAARPKEVP